MEQAKVICDTDVMIDYWNIGQSRHLHTKEVLEGVIGLDNVLISAITKMELLIGVRNKHDLQEVNKKLHRFDIILINDDITLLAIQILQTYKLSHGLEIPDSLIAASSLITKFPLFTYNLKDYKFIDSMELLFL